MTDMCLEIDIIGITPIKLFKLSKTPTSQTPDEEIEKLCPWNPECRKAVESLQDINQALIFDSV